MSDSLESILNRSPLTRKQKADLWDAFEGSSNADDLASRLESFQAPKEVKAKLWDLKSGSTTTERDRSIVPDTPSMKAAQDPDAAQARVAEEAQGSAAGRLASGLWDQINPMPVLKMGYEMSHPDVNRRLAAGKQVVDSVVEGSRDQLNKMDESFREKWREEREAIHRGEASPAGAAIRTLLNPEPVGHLVAAVVPMIGPAAAKAGEMYGAGDVAGGAGATAGLLLPAAAGKAAKGVKPVVAGTATAAKDTSEWLARSAIKPLVSSMKKVAGASSTGVEAQANKLVRFIIDERLATPEQAAKVIQGAEHELQRVLSVKNAPTDAATRAQRYLDVLEKRFKKAGNAESKAATVRAKAEELLRGELGEDAFKLEAGADGAVELVPTRQLREAVPAKEALERARASSKAGTSDNWGDVKGVEIEANKAVERGYRDAVKAAVPEAAPILQRQGKAIQAKEALDRMSFREGNREPAGLGAQVAVAAGAAAGAGPVAAVTGMALEMLRSGKLRGSFALDSVAKALQKAIETNNIPQQAFLLSRLGVTVAPADVRPLAKAAEDDKRAPTRVAGR